MADAKMFPAVRLSRSMTEQEAGDLLGEITTVIDQQVLNAWSVIDLAHQKVVAEDADSVSGFMRDALAALSPDLGMAGFSALGCHFWSNGSICCDYAATITLGGADWRAESIQPERPVVDLVFSWHKWIGQPRPPEPELSV